MPTAPSVVLSTALLMVNDAVNGEPMAPSLIGTVETTVGGVRSSSCTCTLPCDLLAALEPVQVTLKLSVSSVVGARKVAVLPHGCEVQGALAAGFTPSETAAPPVCDQTKVIGSVAFAWVATA